MSDYEDIKELFDVLTVLDFPKKHWGAACGWDMAGRLATALADHTKHVISQTHFFSLSADEVTSITR